MTIWVDGRLLDVRDDLAVLRREVLHSGGVSHWDPVGPPVLATTVEYRPTGRFVYGLAPTGVSAVEIWEPR